MQVTQVLSKLEFRFFIMIGLDIVKVIFILGRIIRCSFGNEKHRYLVMLGLIGVIIDVRYPKLVLWALSCRIICNRNGIEQDFRLLFQPEWCLRDHLMGPILWLGSEAELNLMFLRTEKRYHAQPELVSYYFLQLIDR